MKKIIIILAFVFILAGCEWYEYDPFESPVETPKQEEQIKIPKLVCKDGHCTIE